MGGEDAGRTLSCPLPEDTFQWTFGTRTAPAFPEIPKLWKDWSMHAEKPYSPDVRGRALQRVPDH